MKCLVLDFDLTMTDIHSNGNPDTTKNYWLKPENEQNLYNVLYELKKNGCLIYIVTRSNEYLTQNFIEKSIFKNAIDYVYGSNSIRQISSDQLWPHIKVNCIYDIMLKNKIFDKKQIVYIDDTEMNTNCAKDNGFKNVHNCIGSIELVSIIKKIIKSHFTKQ
jgi:HAD superfamily phosphatase (TIGR01681 family)